MLVDFDKVFDESWKTENISSKCPCKTCGESGKFTDNPYYQSKECDNCGKHAVWMVECIQKLRWLEEGDSND